MRRYIARQVRGTRLDAPLRRLARVRPDPRADPWVARRNREYDRMTARLIRRVLRRDGCAVDAGANEGELLRLLVRAAPLGRHHAFEPIPELAADLRRRFPTTVVHQVALADYDGEATFRYLPADPWESSLYRRPDREAGQDVVELTVPVRRLDSLLPPDQPVAFLKVDVEDAEEALLRGAAGTLHRCRPVVVVECHVRALPVVADLLADAGLEVALLEDVLARRRRPRAETERLAREQGEWYFAAVPRER